MEHFCRLTMLGRATADPVRRTGRGVVVAFGFVFNDREKIGERWVDRPMFIDCEVFGELAETIYKSVRKGFLLLIDGKLRFDEWVDAEKQKHRKHKVVVFGCRVMDRPKSKVEPPADSPEEQGDSLFGAPAQTSEPEAI